MKKQTGMLWATLAGLILLGGCAFQVPDYAEHASGKPPIAAPTTNKYKVGDFIAKNPVDSIHCRGNFPGVHTRGKMPFHAYIREALVEDLKGAGIFAANAGNIINAVLEKVDYHSMSGVWEIEMRVSVTNMDPFDLRSKYDYDTSFIYFIACPNSAKSFPDAVRDFNAKLIQRLP